MADAIVYDLNKFLLAEAISEPIPLIFQHETRTRSVAIWNVADIYVHFYPTLDHWWTWHHTFGQEYYDEVHRMNAIQIEGTFFVKLSDKEMQNIISSLVVHQQLMTKWRWSRDLKSEDLLNRDERIAPELCIEKNRKTFYRMIHLWVSSNTNYIELSWLCKSTKKNANKENLHWFNLIVKQKHLTEFIAFLVCAMSTHKKAEGLED